MTSTFRSVALVGLCLVTAACADTTITPQAPTPNTATPPPAPVIAVSPPVPTAPAAGVSSFGWPTFSWNNAAKENTTNALVYRFDLSARDDFATVAHTANVQEGSGQTSYRPPSTLAAPSEGMLFWRVLAIDQANAVQSQPSEVQPFAYYDDTSQNRLATQLYGSLWSGARPTGTRGRAVWSRGWEAGTRRSFNGVTFMSPPIEALRIFDLLDLGYSPQTAIDWMRANGYRTGIPSEAVWYPSTATIGFPYQYMALVGGRWELVHRVGA